MRIAYLYDELAFWAGADRVIVEKANYFADVCGYEVYLITTYQSHPMIFPLSKKIKHIDMGINFYEQYEYSFFKRGYVYFKLLHIYKKKLEKLLKSLKLDFTITTVCRDLDFITSFEDGSKKIAEAHLSKEYVRDLHLFQRKNILYKIAGRLLSYKLDNAIKKLDAFVVLTQNDANRWSNVRESVVIPNSLPFYPQNISKCTNKKILSVGRLEEQKGYDMLIEAWEIVADKHPDWSISIYGNGKLENILNKEIKEKGLDNSFKIEKPVSNIIEKYLGCSFFVLSSRFEGFGMVLIEAMACGLPVVSFDCPDGPADIIEDTKDGFLVENGNIKELAEKICILIDNKNIRKEMGAKAHENVIRYSPETVMKGWINLFNTLK